MPSATKNSANKPAHVETIRFEAADGHPLEGTLTTGDGNGPLALISSATAVKRGFYQKFAECLVADYGFRAALTYDYRGTGGSISDRFNPRQISMADWGMRDFPAALTRLEHEAPNHRVVGVGQSYGGQALGLGGVSDRFERYLMVATISGYWRHLGGGLTLYALMNLVANPLATLVGRVPAGMGLGSGLPSGVFADWTKWCRKPDYFFTEPRFDAKALFAEVRTPILAVGSTDDPWGTPAARDAIMRHFVNAQVETRWLDPQTAGGPIGHLDFFRSRFRDTLWQDPIDWLKGA
ncbi:alpha/beta fold hydrolase [Hoeflea sp. AS60]|uniref:alpha/beta hydrolase family protein n=1 Tax=Hoeflea sp. AS60 TaxID=3135780 RepID=UPI00317F291F